MIKALTLIVVILMMTAFLGCGKTETPKPAVQAQKVEKKEIAEAPAPAAKPAEKKVEIETYVYEPKGRRDPFLSIIEAIKKEKEAERKKKGLKPTEIFDIADLKLIAIARDKGSYYAMVQFPDNKYFTIKEGVTLGIYGGKVLKIDDNGILVREFIKNYKGETEPKDTILKLRKEEGE